MGTIYKDFAVNATPEFVWDAIRDVGALHTRLAPGLVADTVVLNGIRIITFVNGHVAREQIVALDDRLRRLVSSAIGGRASHHNASFQVFATPDGKSRVVWVSDFLQDDLEPLFAQVMERCSAVIRHTLEKSFNSRQ